MGWIKRNKFFVLSLAAGLILTGYCAILFSKSLSVVSSKKTEYDGDVSQLQALKASSPFPSDTNINFAKEDEARVKELLTNYQSVFAPFTPPTKLDSKGFHNYLAETILQLGIAATNAGVKFGDTFNSFAFTSQVRPFSYPSENLQPWALQLEQIKAIFDVLYAAHINTILSVQRVKISSSDGGDSGDFINAPMVTNAPQVSIPYKIGFRGYSADLAAVLDGFARSKHCFVVKALQVQHETPPLMDTNDVSAPPPDIFVQRPIPRGGDSQGVARPGIIVGPGASPPPVPPLDRRPGPQANTAVTILSERLLKITISLDVIQLNGGGS